MSLKTPFYETHQRLGAEFAVYGQWELPADYGNPEAEFVGLKEKAVTFDLGSFGRIDIRGKNSSDLLKKIFPADIEKLQENKWIWSKICEADVRIAQLPKSYLLLTGPSQRESAANLLKNTAAEAGLGDVQITDKTLETGMQAIYGPVAFDTVEKIMPIDIGLLGENSCMSINVFMMQMTVIRGGWLKGDGIEIIAGSSACKLAAGALEKYQNRRDVIPAGTECLKKGLKAASVAVSL